MRLKDKVCIITGAASGIGKAAALLFSKEGATIIACDMSEENLKVLKEENPGPGVIDTYVLSHK
ncbi:MAG TPA: beta-ketoacyl-ACP reductase, partial [Thermosipho africanus]|nr:beta-ketoacyl-ACP reductase [Thermosipho africanus]